MANKAISELPQAQNVNNQDLFVLEQSGIAKKLTAETFITEQGIIDALAEALDGHGGIQSVTLSSVSGRIRTYRITFTDQSATTFQVYDGTSIDRISRTSSSGLDDVYTIFLSDGTTTFFTVHNGADGNVSEAMLNDALKDKAPAITETTESSAIATFSDGADDMPLHNILAEINPVQDLTYGDPYPAGGGVNILPPPTSATASASGTITNDNGLLTISTTGEIVTFFIRIPEFTFAESGQKIELLNSFTNGTVYFFNGNTQVDYFSLSSVNRVVSESSMSAMKGKTINSYRITVNTQTLTNATFAMMVTDSSASALTAFSPYSNICPITGWTGCNVTRTGANLYSVDNGAYNVPVYGTGGTIGSYPDVHAVWIPVKPNTLYTVASAGTESATFYVRWINCTSDKSFISRPGGAYNSTQLPLSFSTPSNCYWVEVVVNQYQASQISKNDWEISVIATADTTYEPYQGETVSVDWQTEAGTVYGGTIDVATGLLTVTHKIWTADGTVPWTVSGEGTADATFYTGTGYDYDTLVYSNNGYSNYFKYSYSFSTRGAVMAYTNRININSGSGFTTRAELQAAFAETPLQVLYPIAQPQTYQLTGQQLMTLLGNNSVWADTGNVSVTYPADTKMFIEKLTMPTEDDLVANQAITSGKYFMIGNSLYLALANIASGAQITIGTNAQRVSLADALNTINS